MAILALSYYVTNANWPVEQLLGLSEQLFVICEAERRKITPKPVLE
jgi:hypothetical protein